MKLLTFTILMLTATPLFCQTKKIDSLNRLISLATSDTAKINLTVRKMRDVAEISLDSAIRLGYQTLQKAQAIQYGKGEADMRVKLAQSLAFKGEFDSAKQMVSMAESYYQKTKDSLGLLDVLMEEGTVNGIAGEYAKALQFYHKAIALAGRQHQTHSLGTLYQNTAISYQMQSDFYRASAYYRKALEIADKEKDLNSAAYIALNLGMNYNSMNDLDKGEQNLLKAISIAKQLGIKNVELYGYANIASIYAGKHQYELAYQYAKKAEQLATEMGDLGIKAASMSRAALQLLNLNRLPEAEALSKRSVLVADSSKQPFNIFQTNSYTGEILVKEKKYSEARSFYEKAFTAIDSSDLYDEQVALAYKNLSECYETTGDYNKALQAYKSFAGINDSLTSKENIRKATEQNLSYEFEKQKQQAKAAQNQKDELAKSRQTALIIGLALTVTLLSVSLYAFQNKRKANRLLTEQNTKIETTLQELKATQQQLIQSEKMASLGELTAGIAHEIQNPLNFVNNFSEVNSELIDEMKEELANGNTAAANDLATDIRHNLEKITHHGKRADSIVKGMLAHSRQNKLEKEPTNVNTLCDEYLRLAYHGMRAKDKSFTAEFITDFENDLGKINVVPQDLGRVLLNLFSNAFYAVNEKRKGENANYKPRVTVGTKRTKEGVKITISDNGGGIPSHVIDKIFNPFFTTKPTGQGTGLGLSLAYDIITKQHKGTIDVKSEPGEGTEFTLCLPAFLS